MKKYLLMIMLLSFVGIRAENVDSLINASGWEDFGDYKAQKLKVGEITHRQISKDGKTLFTADANKYFRLWDIETGKLLKSIYVEHQLPVFLMNDTLILYRDGILNPKFQENVKGYSLIDEISYNFLPHIFYYTNEDLLLSNSTIQMINDSILVLPVENIEVASGGAQVAFYLNGAFYNINTKVKIKNPIQFSTFNNIFFINNNNYLADSFGKVRNKLGQISDYYNVNIYNSSKQVRYDISNSSPNNFRTITFDKTSGKLYVCEFNQLHIFDSKTKINNISLTDNLSSICLYDSVTIVGYSPNNKRIVIYNLQTKLYNYNYTISNNQINKLDYLPEINAFLTTDNRGQICFLNGNILDKNNVSFKIETNPILMLKQVSFSNLDQSHFDNFHWDFGDGETSKEIQPSHFYKQEGKYKIVLTGSKDGSFSTYTDSITILPNYYPTFEIDKSYGNAPLTVNFRNTSNFIADSIFWDFENSEVDFLNANEGYVKYVIPDTFVISLIAYKSGEKFQFKRSIIVNGQDTSKFDLKALDYGERYYGGGGNSYTLVINKFLGMAPTNDNNVAYLTFNRVTDNIGGIVKQSEKLVFNRRNNNENSLKVILKENITDFYPFINGGFLRLVGDTFKIYDRNFNYLHKIRNENYYRTFHVVSNKYILVKGNNKIIFFDEFFKIIKEFSLFDLINDGIESIADIQFHQSPNKLISNQNVFVFIQSHTKVLTIIEIEDLNIKHKYSLNDFNLSSYSLTSKNELCLISKSGELKLLDLNNGTAKDYTNIDYTKYSYFDDNILFSIRKSCITDPKGILIEFVNYEGQLIYTFHSKVVVNSYMDAVYHHYKSFDNTIYLLMSDYPNECYLLMSLIPSNGLIPLNISEFKHNLPSLSPNPASDFININQVGIKNLKVYDLNGIELDCESEYFENMVRVNTFMLQTGIYFVRYEINGKIYNEKFVKI